MARVVKEDPYRKDVWAFTAGLPVKLSSMGDVMDKLRKERETPGEVDYNDAKSVITALQEDESIVDIRELQCPERVSVLEEVTKGVFSLEGMDALKEMFFEACLVQTPLHSLVKVDLDVANKLFAMLLQEKASVSSLLYPFLVLLQSEERGGFFQEGDLRQRLPEKMGVSPESIQEELDAALRSLREKEILTWSENGEMCLNLHFFEASREEVLANGRMPVVVQETPPELDDVEIHKGLTPFQYSLRSKDSKR